MQHIICCIILYNLYNNHLNKLNHRHREETKPIPTLLKSTAVVAIVALVGTNSEIHLNEKSEAPGLSIDHLRLGY